MGVRKRRHRSGDCAGGVNERNLATEVSRLRSLRKTRTRAVFELRAELSIEPPVLDVPYWQLSPHTDLNGESLQHLLFDHAVDARVPSEPTIRTVSQAVAAGARPLTQGPGDVETKDGPAWCDGGPLEWFDGAELGAPVIPALHLSIGSLSTINNNSPSADLAANLAADQLRAVAHSGGVSWGYQSRPAGQRSLPAKRGRRSGHAAHA